MITQPDPQGARALAERLGFYATKATDSLGQPYDVTLFLGTPEQAAAAILGPNGLFVADRTKHEPVAVARLSDDFAEADLECDCGWKADIEGESYFDHISGGPS